jgi:hypothetical protein
MQQTSPLPLFPLQIFQLQKHDMSIRKGSISSGYQYEPIFLLCTLQYSISSHSDASGS